MWVINLNTWNQETEACDLCSLTPHQCSGRWQLGIQSKLNLEVVKPVEKTSLVHPPYSSPKHHVWNGFGRHLIIHEKCLEIISDNRFLRNKSYFKSNLWWIARLLVSGDKNVLFHGGTNLWHLTHLLFSPPQKMVWSSLGKYFLDQNIFSSQCPKISHKFVPQIIIRLPPHPDKSPQHILGW